MRGRVAVWGVVAAAVYVAAAAFTARVLPVRPIFDGLAPIGPYNWVHAPSGAPSTQKPARASQKVPLSRAGSGETSVATLDGQATLILPLGAFPQHGKDTDVLVDILPRDGGQYGRPPARLAYAGNAYDMHARYEPSGMTANLVLDATVLLTYATNLNATKILYLNGLQWVDRPTTDVAASFQVFSRTRQLGVFVPAGRAIGNALRWWTLGIASGIAALLGTAFGLRERRRLRRQ